jgi:exodeoxyribonuclease V alpha subunit
MPSIRKTVEEIRAIYVMEKYRNGNFAIAVFRDPSTNANVSVLGDMPEGELTPQIEYRLYGKRENNEKFGPQFRLSTFVIAKPHSRTGVIRYLCKAGQGKGLGEATATALWNKFGADAVRILRESPEVAVAAAGARGFSLEKAQAVAEQLTEWSSIEDCSIDLIELLNGRGFPRDLARKAVKAWGNRASEMIQRDPYKLMRFRGIGFLKTDAMYLDLGLPPTRLKRQAYAAAYAVASDSNGHIWHPVEHAVKGITAKIAGQDCEQEKAISLAKRGKILAERIDSDGKRWVAEKSDADNESFVAQHISNAMAEKPDWPSVEILGGGVSEHQIEQLSRALRGAIGLFCGSPGTGKTFTAAPLIREIINRHGIDSIACAAPTGKAAVRLSESLASYRVPIKATTIHSLLGVDTTPDGDDSRSGWSFKHNEYNPLPFEYIVIDESSMIDLSLMRSLLCARAKGTCILFIGDVNQLPPVGRGAPLRDFIEAGLPYGELTEIRRNAGTIVRACAAIRDNRPMPVDTVLAPSAEPPANLKIIPAVQAIAPKVILDLVAKIRDQRLCDPIWDVQVIVAVNKRSPLCRTALNKSLQAELNPAGYSIPGSPFRVGDKVIVLKNSTLPLDGTQETCFVANGEFGCVVEVHEKRTIVDFKMPDRRVVIPRGVRDPKEGESSDDDSGTGCDMDLGYAATCHKLQGSSAKIVIIALDEYPGATGQFGVCDKAWIYTAISRAEQICFLVGKSQTIIRMCNRTAIKDRKTFLVEDIGHYLKDFKIDFAPMPRVAIPTSQPALADLFA